MDAVVCECKTSKKRGGNSLPPIICAHINHENQRDRISIFRRGLAGRTGRAEGKPCRGLVSLHYSSRNVAKCSAQQFDDKLK